MIRTNAKRIEWIDVLKGMLIILMIMGHVPNLARRMGFDDTNYHYFYLVLAVYGCFFMQTFFMLTGYTTNFKIPFGKFLVKQLKQIVLPYFSFCMITKIIGVLLFNESLFSNVGGQSIFFLWEGYWFLTALLIAKLIYYFIAKIPRQAVQFLLCMAVCVLGFAITYIYKEMPDASHYNNYFHYRNGLCMVIFLWLGTVIHKVPEKGIYALSAGFILLYVCTFLINWRTDLPLLGLMPMEYTHTCKFVSFLQVVPYLFYAFSGSMIAIFIAQKIKKQGVLEYIGKNSLVFYCMHFTVIQCLIPTFFKITPPHFGIYDVGKSIYNNSHNAFPVFFNNGLV